MIAMIAEVGAGGGEASIVLVNVAFIVAFAAGAIKCAAIMSRPEAHKLCVGSLAIVMIAGVLFSILQMVRVLFTLPALASAIGALLLAAGLLLAWVLAVVGLVDYRRRADDYLHGRGQAWTALALSTVPLGFIGLAFAYGIVQGVQASAGRNAVKETSPAGEQGRAKAPRSTLASPFGNESSDRQATQRFEKFNFEFTPPDENWVKMHAASVNPDAVAAYMTKTPQTLFIIIAEKVGADVPIDTKALCEIIKANMQLNAEDAVIGDETLRTVAGVDGIVFEARMTVNGVENHACYWLASRNGFQYQLITAGEARHSSRINDRHESMLAGFQLLDPDSVVFSNGVKPVGKYDSPRHGFQIDLSGAAWASSAAASQLCPAAELVATLSDHAVIAVVPLRLPSDDVSLDDVANALATNCITGFDASRRANVRSERTATDDEVEFSYDAPFKDDVTLGYRIRAVRRGRQATIAYGWAGSDDPASMAALEKGLRLLSVGDAPKTDEPGTEEQRSERGLVLNQVGIQAASRSETAVAVACFEEALKLQPRNATVLQNLVHVLNEQGETERALAELEKHVEAFPDDFTIREALASQFYETGDKERCREILEKLLAEGSKSEDSVILLAAILVTEGDDQAALAAVDRFLKHGPSQRLTQMRGNLLSRLGDHAAAIALMEEVRKAHPKDVANLIDLAATYEAAEQYQQGLDLTQQLLEMGKVTEEVHILRGRCQLGLKDRQKAKESFELALAMSPQSDEAREWVALASAMLGQGNNSLVKTPIEPVAMPAEIANRLTNLPPDEEAAGAFGAYEQYRIVGYDYRPGQRRRTTNYRKIKIVGQAGVDRFATLTVEFNPLSERVYVNRLAVLDAAGQIVAEGNPNDYFVVEAQGELATGDHTLTIPTPQLKAGNTLEFTYTCEYVSVDEFGYEEVVLTSMVPVQAAAVFVVGEVGALAHTSSGPVMRQAADGSLYWGVSDPPVYVAEYSQPPFAEFLPAIHLSDAKQEWTVIGNEYCDLIAERLRPDPIVAETAAKITAGIANDEEKIAALSQYVQRQLNYQGVEFGVRGHMPNGAAKTLANGYGDCKDHSILLKQLLDAAGIPAQLTLINSVGEGDRRLPSSFQFDHMIVSVPRGAGDAERIYIDCTAKHSDPREAITNDFTGNFALVLEPTASRLIDIAPRTSVSTVIHCGREVTITCDDPQRETADATVREKVTLNSNAAASLRQIFIGMKPREREETFAGLISERGDVDVSRLDVANLEDSSKPLILDCEYRIEDLFHRAGGAGSPMSGQVPSPWESLLTSQLAAKERITPFRTSSASLTSSTRFNLPDGFAFERALESVQPNDENRFFKWRIEANPSANESVVFLERRAGKHAADSFEGYLAEGKKLTSQLRRPIAIRENTP